MRRRAPLSPAAAAALPPDAAATATATAAAAAASSSGELAQFGGAVGGACGLVAAALWSLERGAAARAAAALEAAREELKRRDGDIAALRAELAAAKAAEEEAEFLRRRLDEATKSVFKLEKALEIKDGQLDTFINTARRQIRALEDDVRALQAARPPPR